MHTDIETDIRMASLLNRLETKGVNTGVGLAASGGKAAVKGALEDATDESSKVCVKITNKTRQRWTRPKLFLNCGATDDLLPLTVDDGEDIEYEVHKKKWTFTGIAGVITYEWIASGTTYYLAIMFRKPRVSHNNWNAMIYESDTEANQQLFAALKQNRGPHPAVRGDANYTTREFGSYTMQGAMSSSGAAKLHVIISCT